MLTGAELCKLLLGCIPYEGFDESNWTLDLQGWSSNDRVIFDTLHSYEPSLVIELGSWKGASAIAMAQELLRMGRNTPIICVDTWLGSSSHFLHKDSEDHFSSLMSRHGYPQLYYQFLANVVYTGSTSLIVPLPQTTSHAAQILAHLQLTPDYIYVDASHSYADVLLDLQQFWPLLANGGCLLGDDYHWTWPGVVRAAQEFSRNNNIRLYIDRYKYLLTRNIAKVPPYCILVADRPNLYWEGHASIYTEHP